MSAIHASNRTGPAATSASQRIYSRLLRVYPSAFRDRYEAEMVVLFGDQLRDARAGAGAGGVVTTWFRTLADLVGSALGEHLRKDRMMAQTLASFQPTRSMRALGVLAVVGGVLLVAVWLVGDVFSTPGLNSWRLGLFWLAGLAVAIAFYGRQAAVAPRLALVTSSLIVLTSAWNIAWLVLAIGRDSPFSADFGFLGFLASFLGWLAAAVYGAGVLLGRAAWRGMTRTSRVATQLAAAVLVVAGPVATFGMDRLGLTRSEPYGELFGTLGALGVTGVGAAWILFGAVLLLANRRSGAPST
jgi:hypothetical protein